VNSNCRYRFLNCQSLVAFSAATSLCETMTTESVVVVGMVTLREADRVSTTVWWMTQSEANPSLDYGSLLAGKKAGNNAFLGCRRGRVRRKMIVPQAFSTGFPTQENRETRRPSREVLLTMQGNLSFGLFVLLNLQRRIH
jgi:hypothetical protein